MCNKNITQSKDMKNQKDKKGYEAWRSGPNRAIYDEISFRLQLHIAAMLAKLFPGISQVEGAWFAEAYTERLLQLAAKFEQGTKDHGGNFFECDFDHENDNESLDSDHYTEGKRYAAKYAPLRAKELGRKVRRKG